MSLPEGEAYPQPLHEAYPQPLPEGKGGLKYFYATRWAVDCVLNMAGWEDKNTEGLPGGGAPLLLGGGIGFYAMPRSLQMVLILASAQSFFAS